MAIVAVVAVVAIIAGGGWLLARWAEDDGAPAATGTTEPTTPLPTFASSAPSTAVPPPDTRVWSPVTSSSGRYTVSLPGPPAVEVTGAGSTAEIQLTFHGDRPGTVGGSGVGLFEIADPSRFGDPELTASISSNDDRTTALRAMSEDFAASVVVDARATFSASSSTGVGPGLRFAGTDGDKRDGMAYEGFAVLDQGRLLVVLATGPSYDQQNVQRAAARASNSLRRR